MGAAVYKGVLFSTTAQPGWGNARWLGGYFANSALLLGAVGLLLLATAMGQAEAASVLRLGAMLLLVLNAGALVLLLGELSTALSRAHGPRWITAVGMVVLAGIVVPLVLLALGGALAKTIAALLILLGAMVIRAEIVRLPHLLTRTERR